MRSLFVVHLVFVQYNNAQLMVTSNIQINYYTRVI